MRVLWTACLSAHSAVFAFGRLFHVRQDLHAAFQNSRNEYACQNCPVQGPAAQAYFGLVLSTVEAALGSLPDWKSTAFWRNSSFLQAWSRALALPYPQEARADYHHHYMCALIPLQPFMLSVLCSRPACSGVCALLTVVSLLCLKWWLRKVSTWT